MLWSLTCHSLFHDSGDHLNLGVACVVAQHGHNISQAVTSLLAGNDSLCKAHNRKQQESTQAIQAVASMELMFDAR
jgi:hypothetical protein